MTELKTLNTLLPDVMVNKIFGDPKGKTPLQRKNMMVGAYTKDYLKQEAIKHIKAIRNSRLVSSTSQVAGEDIATIIFVGGKEKKVTTKEALLLQELSYCKSGKVDLWIEDFFNIKKKDLKC